MESHGEQQKLLFPMAEVKLLNNFQNINACMPCPH
jgi:hypothetical protein